MLEAEYYQGSLSKLVVSLLLPLVAFLEEKEVELAQHFQLFVVHLSHPILICFVIGSIR